MAELTIPNRIQRRRMRGWRMPPNTIYVGRPSKWGNPFQLSDAEGGVPAVAVESYRQWWFEQAGPWRFNALRRLRGRNLACWCKLCATHKDGKPLDVECPDCAPCHADVLGKLATA